ncbi:MAG: EamA family transporter [Phyllobacteriaceae bacterium]|nr:EamA family transporter [Phyllobacteriaceae bacterium]
MPIRDVLLALMVVAIWGFNFVVIAVGVAEVPPLLLTGLRFLFAALPAVFFVKRPDCDPRWIVAFGLVLGVVKFGLLFVGMKAGMPAGLSSLVLQMQAFFTMGLAFALLGERPKPAQLVGAGIAALGILVIASTRTGAGAPLGPFLMVLAAAACWGLANIVTKKAGTRDMLGFVVWASLVAPLPLFALSLVFEGPQAIAAALLHPTWLSIGAVAYLAWPTTVVGFCIWSSLMSRHPAATVAPFSLLVPVFGMSSAYLVLGEPVGGREAIGAALVIAGLVVNVFGPRLVRA